MTIKSILFYSNGNKEEVSVIENALSLAEHFSANVKCLYISPDILLATGGSGQVSDS